jgi:hypothetical protein
LTSGSIFEQINSKVLWGVNVRGSKKISVGVCWENRESDNIVISKTQLEATGAGTFSISHIGGHDFSEAGRDFVGEWLTRIDEVYARGAAHTLHLAKLVCHARMNLKHGAWAELWRLEAAPFSQRKANMLVAIGHTMESLNEQNSARLPTAWNTLYYLARLGSSLVMRLISEGRIHPQLALKEARSLLDEFRPGRNRKRPLSKVRRRLAGFVKFVDEGRDFWSRDERTAVVTELARLLSMISADPKLVRRAIDSESGEPVRFDAGDYGHFSSIKELTVTES